MGKPVNVGNSSPEVGLELTIVENSERIVTHYAHMWPRTVFDVVKNKKLLIQGVKELGMPAFTSSIATNNRIPAPVD